MGIANSVLDAVKSEVQRRPGCVPRRVGLRVGILSAIDQESLRFCFEALTRETALESLELAIETCPRKHQCLNCGQIHLITDHNFRCPQCASLNTECVGGDELELAYLEVDDDGASTAGTKSTE